MLISNSESCYCLSTQATIETTEIVANSGGRSSDFTYAATSKQYSGQVGLKHSSSVSVLHTKHDRTGAFLCSLRQNELNYVTKLIMSKEWFIQSIKMF